MSKRGSGGGRNSKFTPENKAALIARLELGMDLAEAADASKLKPATVQGWLARGRREDEGDYAEFAAVVGEAKARRGADAMTPEEHRQKVSEVARSGNVQALKLYWEMIEADRNTGSDEEKEADPLEEVDELAQRRAAGA